MSSTSSSGGGAAAGLASGAWTSDLPRTTHALTSSNTAVFPCPLCRLQRGDGGVQEHQLHCVGCGRSGQGEAKWYKLKGKLGKCRQYTTRQAHACEHDSPHPPSPSRRSAPCGDTTSKTRKASSSWWTAMIETVLGKPGTS